METELQQFNQERSERIRLLREKHERQLENFDVESASMGFRWERNLKLFPHFKLSSNFNFSSALALAEASQETYPEEEGSLSGSMLSLAHSNSSTSFPAGSL